LGVQMRIDHLLPATKLFHGAFNKLAATVATMGGLVAHLALFQLPVPHYCPFLELRRLGSFAPSPTRESRDEDHPGEGCERQLSRH
jgi:hypothetical protein